MTETFVNRVKDFFISNLGERIDPKEIEDFYTKAAPVKEMCVFIVSGMDGVKKSKVLWAVIQPDLDNFREFGEVNLRSVLKERFDNIAQSLPSYKRLNGFTVTLDDLPHTLFGKLERYAVKKIYEPRVIAGKEGALPVLADLTAADLVLIESENGIKILECLKTQSGIKRLIILEDSLELDIGIDSLGRIELTSGLGSAFSADIKVEAISRAFSVKDLILEITDALKEGKDIPSKNKRISLGADYWKKNLRVPPRKENLEMLELSIGYFAWLFRFILTGIDLVIFKLFFSIKEEGAANVPKEGAYILYGNHASFLDG
ncbi:MAG: hypothetical protein NT079_03825, partial [Candidatus Omnitrophica bacterium]|nr:hypothetical protein [Candidatus Omnitrophota bacterium]